MQVYKTRKLQPQSALMIW